MPRGGRSPTRSTTYAQAPIRTQAAPVTAPSKGGMFSGLGRVMMEGMAFGAGSEVAHQAIRGITGSGSHSQQVIVQAPPQAMPQQSFNKCQFESDSFVNCLKTNSDSLDQCQSYFDMLKGCEKQY